MQWYRHEKINEHITRIIDIAGVACYLIEGETKACLLDTCCGYGNLKEYVKELTDKEIFVILTHGHYDHVGSASFFDEVYMSHEELPVLSAYNSKREYLLEYDKNMKPALKDITMDQLNPLYQGNPIDLKDGQRFDLGDITIRMILVKGHTPGSMCALLEEDEIIFYGDACGTNVLLHDEFSSTVSEYLESLKKLEDCQDQYQRILRNHGTFENDKSLLENVKDCCKEILNHTDDHNPVLLYDKTVYEAKKRLDGNRIDGKEGNVIYAPDKQQ